ncbi:Peptidase C48 SUMO/Sentrin/Ubl1 [Penicillium herquei]|nr:Peptidase C48 SUMO/Sentrin/Ubl1 [Penicillium herquei]
MLNQDSEHKKTQARQDEARLLGAKYKDINAVHIRPGSSLPRKPGSSSAFRPTDRISRNASSRVGTSRQAASILKKNPPRLGDPIELDNASQPAKKRVKNELSDGFDLAFNEVHEATHPPPSHSLAQSTALSPRSLPKTTSSHPFIQPSSPLQSSPSKMKALQSNHDSGESDDEIQGDVTTHPPPKQINEKRSSTDMDPFMLSGSRKKAKKSHHASKAVFYEIVYLHFGDLRKNVVKGKKEGAAICMDEHKILLQEDVVGKGEKEIDIPLRTIDRVSNGKKCCKVSLHLSRGASKLGGIVDIEFLELPEKIDFISRIGRSTKVQKRTEDFMASAFKKNELEHAAHDAQKKRSREDIELTTVSEAPSAPGLSGTRSKVSSSLQDTGGEPKPKRVKGNLQRTGLFDGPVESREVPDSQSPDPENVQILDSGAVEVAITKIHESPKRRPVKAQLSGPKDSQQSELQHVQESEAEDDQKPEPEKAPRAESEILEVPESPGAYKTDPKIEVKVPLPKARGSLDRETRSTRRTTRKNQAGTQSSPPPQKPIEKETNWKKWKKPLVYPRAGKKRAEVSTEDRERLREDEFLNDNLIAFYLRFLQDHLERTNEEFAKRVYFFNSYFFETLKNSPSGSIDINYSGVEKWTRNINLFEYDYIIVPINENAHWYVAIICNLPKLDASSEPDSHNDATGPKGSASSSDQTHIITFDSLDISHYPTNKVLRQYLSKESLSKRGIDISSKATAKGIKGLRATNLPLQNNYSDCGLYLLAYVEKFVQDPDSFIENVLQRKTGKVEWPDIKPGLLRQRLRQFLDDLYEEQKHHQENPLMVDQFPISFLLGAAEPEKADNDQHDEADDEKKPQTETQPTISSKDQKTETIDRTSEIVNHEPDTVTSE